MGREIRRVPADWEHPKDSSDGLYKPLIDEDYDAAAEKWMAELDLWRKGEHPDQGKEYCKGYRYFWEWTDTPPDRDSYRARKWTREEATHFQVYENVSEGTPITPVFATRQEVADYLVTHGDFWGNKWRRESAELFVKNEWAPSMIIENGRVMTPETQT